MITRGSLSKYFIGAAAKGLKAVEVDPTASKQHEFQSVDIFRTYLGTPADKVVIPVTYLWMDDEDEAPLRIEASGTWYNTRKRTPHRPPEYRLYYPHAANPVVYRARPGDTLFLCMTTAGRLLAILCPSGSSIEQKLLWLFGLELSLDFALVQRDLSDGGRGIDFAAGFILDELGIEPEIPETEAFERLVKKFGLTFPRTDEFSAFARSCLKQVDPVNDPDGALLSWMELDEALFRRLEREVVAERLKSGFMKDGEADVEGFLRFSLSVQNRRKSRAGFAFAHHIEEILKANGIRHRREATTEKRAAADFLFPGEAEYADPLYPAENLRMLAVKTTCKDRWRQVLAEADRITDKHLLTLEPAISRAQTAEMQAHNLHLVLPKALHATFHPEQRPWLMSFGEFISSVKAGAQPTLLP